jgi:hypothetical protein
MSFLTRPPQQQLKDPTRAPFRRSTSRLLGRHKKATREQGGGRVAGVGTSPHRGPSKTGLRASVSPHLRLTCLIMHNALSRARRRFEAGTLSASARRYRNPRRFVLGHFDASFDLRDTSTTRRSVLNRRHPRRPLRMSGRDIVPVDFFCHRRRIARRVRVPPGGGYRGDSLFCSICSVLGVTNVTNGRVPLLTIRLPLVTERRR